MATVIPNKKQLEHDIYKYNFKVFSVGESHKEETHIKQQQSKENSMRKESKISSSTLGISSKDSLIESLMRKADEMSSNFIKLQMKLENITQEHEKELKKLKKESFNEGLKTAKEQAQKQEKENITNGIAQFAASIIALEQSSKITLKVNPKNYKDISKSIGLLENVNIVSDNAVSQGGAIVISDAGNIDAQIFKRFDKVKRRALSE